MSTLGELLAEHTVLPGDAVDHLHAVVGEWQLLADLSFADYLMWVRRDDGALVCVAQCRPNTAPTVLLTDAVGTVADAEQRPQVAAAFESGTIGSAETEAGVQAVPVRHGDAVVAVLTHQAAVTTRRKSSPLEIAYLDCANDLLQMLSEGTFPNVGDLAVSRSSPRVGRRVHPAGRQRRRGVRQPERDLGLSPHGPDLRTGGAQPRSGDPAADLRPVRGAGTRRARSRLARRRLQHAPRGGRRRRCDTAAHAAVDGAPRVASGLRC